MKAVVFDLDGTLIDSAPDLLHAANAILGQRGAAPLELAQLRGFIGNGTPKLVERSLKARDLPAVDGALAEAHRDFMTVYIADPVARTVLYPGVIAALDALRDAAHVMAICTNKPEAPTRAVLEHFGLGPYFGAVIGGDSLPVHKPDPAPLRAALAGIGADTATYVGDSETDAATAQAAALPFGLFTEGYRKAAVSDLPHSFAFDDFADLPTLIAAHQAAAAR